MYWVIQKGFDYDPKYQELCKNLERMDIDHTFCTAIPFSGRIIEDIDVSDKGPVFTYGSYTLSKIAKERGWEPGSYISPNLGMKSLLKNYGDMMLNSDMEFHTIGNLETNMKEFFIRPEKDSKAFTAGVRTIEEFNKWRDSISQIPEGEFSTVNLDTEVIISTPKKIQQEIRFFIVDKNVIDCSYYKFGDQVRYDNNVNDVMALDCAWGSADTYSPDVAYVLDIAMSDGEFYVLETNSINSSGFYAIDTQKLVMAIEDLGKYGVQRYGKRMMK